MTDGPFIETKEYLGGFYIIEAADVDAALEWASKAEPRHRLADRGQTIPR